MSADLLQVLELVKAALMVDTHLLVLELASLPKLRVSVFILCKPYAWRESSELEE